MADFNNEDWGTLLVRDEWNNESGMELLLSGETPML
jgi:hypothetical protein